MLIIGLIVLIVSLLIGSIYGPRSIIFEDFIRTMILINFFIDYRHFAIEFKERNLELTLNSPLPER